MIDIRLFFVVFFVFKISFTFCQTQDSNKQKDQIDEAQNLKFVTNHSKLKREIRRRFDTKGLLTYDDYADIFSLIRKTAVIFDDILTEDLEEITISNNGIFDITEESDNSNVIRNVDYNELENLSKAYKEYYSNEFNLFIYKDEWKWLFNDLIFTSDNCFTASYSRVLDGDMLGRNYIFKICKNTEEWQLVVEGANLYVDKSFEELASNLIVDSVVVDSSRNELVFNILPVYKKIAYEAYNHDAPVVSISNYFKKISSESVNVLSVIFLDKDLINSFNRENNIFFIDQYKGYNFFNIRKSIDYKFNISFSGFNRMFDSDTSSELFIKYDIKDSFPLSVIVTDSNELNTDVAHIYLNDKPIESDTSFLNNKYKILLKIPSFDITNPNNKLIIVPPKTDNVLTHPSRPQISFYTQSGLVFNNFESSGYLSEAGADLLLKNGNKSLGFLQSFSWQYLNFDRIVEFGESISIFYPEQHRLQFKTGVSYALLANKMQFSLQGYFAYAFANSDRSDFNKANDSFYLQRSDLGVSASLKYLVIDRLSVSTNYTQSFVNQVATSSAVGGRRLFPTLVSFGIHYKLKKS